MKWHDLPANPATDAEPPAVAARMPAALTPDEVPHLLRHSLASAMAAAKEPASVIAGQLRHADGGTLASRTYIHQLPQTPPRLARLIEPESTDVVVEAARLPW